MVIGCLTNDTLEEKREQSKKNVYRTSLFHCKGREDRTKYIAETES